MIRSLCILSLMGIATANAAYTTGQQQILAASAAWQQGVDQHNPQAVAALYDPHTYFYPTFTTEITNPQDLLNYFVGFAKKTDSTVVFNQQNPRVYNNVGIDSGLYTFSYQAQGKTVQIPARFTFIYLKEQGKWMIIEHHSSVRPETVAACGS